MIEIRVENHQAHSKIIVSSGNRTIMNFEVSRPIDHGTYYRQIAPMLGPMIRGDESYLYCGKERLRMTVEPLTGFMSSGGRSVVDLIREMQEGPSESENDAWKPARILETVLEISQAAHDSIEDQARSLEEKNIGFLKDQEADEMEEEHRKLEKAIVGDKKVQTTMTPLEAARRRAAKRREAT